MRKIFILALAAFMFAACNKTNDQTPNAQMVNDLTDYHAHAIPDSYRELVAKHGMALDEGFPLPQWSAETHLQMMAEAGIDRVILTLPAPIRISATKRSVPPRADSSMRNWQI